jgi:peroxiredoxin Q/BCP
MNQKISDPALDLRLPDSQGQMKTLRELLQQGPQMVVFYPGDFTPVCTVQLCSYRDHFAEFQGLGIGVVGVSPDSVEKHARFMKQYQFPFPLLSDPKSELAKALGATSKWLLGAVTRANYILSRDGEILYAHNEAIPVTRRKPEELKDVLSRLRTEGKLK